MVDAKDSRERVDVDVVDVDDMDVGEVDGDDNDYDKTMDDAGDGRMEQVDDMDDGVDDSVDVVDVVVGMDDGNTYADYEMGEDKDNEDDVVVDNNCWYYR